MYYYGRRVLVTIDRLLNSIEYDHTPIWIENDIDAIKTVIICSGVGAGDGLGDTEYDRLLDGDNGHIESEVVTENLFSYLDFPPFCYIVTVDGWNANRDFRPKRGIRTTRVQGYARPLEFYSPAYRDGALPPGTDKRRTLYWNPSVKTDKNGCAVIECYNSDRTSPLTISVETICGGMPGAVVKHSVD